MINSRSASLLLAIASVLVASPIWAQTGTNTSTSTSTNALQKTDFEIDMMRKDGDSWVYMTAIELQTFFNQANCLCKTPLRARVRMIANRTKLAQTSTGRMRLLIGQANCMASAETDRNSANCYGSATNPDPALTSNSLAQLSSVGYWDVDLTTWDLFTRDNDATHSDVDCSSRSFTQTLWFWITTNSTDSSVPDLYDGNSGTVSLALNLDGLAPPTPTGITVKGGNEALDVTWAAPDTTTADLAGYVLFCTRADYLQVFKDSFYNKQYYTKATTCSADTTSSPLLDSRILAPTTSTQTQTVSVPAHIAALDPAYMCSDLVPAQTTSHRIYKLQNDIPYLVGLAAVDRHGNASAIPLAYYQKPVPTRDFYREYRDAGGQDEGGYCTLAHGHVRASALVFGVLGLGVAWTLRRRGSRRSRGSRTLLVLFPLLVAGRAQAQAITHDYDDMYASDGLDSSDPNRFRSPRNWAFELRFGPYLPNIDSEFTKPNATLPQATVMGTGHHLMSQFELDWELVHTIGTLGIGLQAGYMSESAKAFVANPDGTASTTRSGDNTTLRIMPVAALAVYRMDLAAEYWHIPLVPYAKAGLNYTFWSVTDGNGETPQYKGGGKGKGGTPGWQAALGIALQLDFLDPSAARGFDSDMGVNHTYAFFEWNHVAADGLGASGKMHLGDSTWVAGLMIEF